MLLKTGPDHDDPGTGPRDWVLPPRGSLPRLPGAFCARLSKPRREPTAFWGQSANEVIDERRHFRIWPIATEIHVSWHVGNQDKSGLVCSM
jgi:hypothetical protein